MGDSRIELRDLTKVYDDGTVAVDGLNLDIEHGEFLVLVGPSGCGKSTTLRMIAGLEEASSGELRIDGERVNEMMPRDRGVAMVFQNFALYPHMSVRENMGFALRIGGKATGAIDRRVRQMSSLLELDDHLGTYPPQLSGGEQQRVAMGRAMVRRPAVFLMDEPLSNLDAKLRVSLRAEMLRLIRRVRGTTVYVTHDQAEAMTMGDRVAVLRGGKLQQLGAPAAIYEKPANIFVAAFVGSPRMNMLLAVPQRTTGGDLELDFGSQRLVIPRSSVRYPSWLVDDILGRAVTVGLRPEALSYRAPAPESPEGPVLRGEVSHVEFLGHETLVHVAAEMKVPRIDEFDPGSDPNRVHPDASVRAKPGVLARAARSVGLGRPREPVEAQAPAMSAGVPEEGELIARLGANPRLGIGDEVAFTVDLHGLHLFDTHGDHLPALLLDSGTGAMEGA